MNPIQALPVLWDQFAFYARLRESRFSRALYFGIYYFLWIFLRWGDRHARALKVLRALGLSNREASIVFPDGTRMVLDQYTIHHVLYSVYREKVYAPSPIYEPQPGQIVLDIGAQQGIYTCWAARKIGPKGRLYAFEPHPGNYQRLTQNISLNHFSWVDPVNVALFNKPGHLSLYIHPDSVNHSLVHARQGQTVQVECATLDAIAASHPIGRADLIKLDVEGAELSVLEGAQNYLGECHPRLVMEYEVQDDLPKMINLLKSLGYQVNTKPGYLYASFM